MHVAIVDADFDNAAHRAGILDVLNSYAADPVGGGETLGPDVRERLVPALRDHPTGLVLLAIAEERPVGIAVCFLGFSTFLARPLLNIHDLAVLQVWAGLFLLLRRIVLGDAGAASSLSKYKMTTDGRWRCTRASGSPTWS